MRLLPVPAVPHTYLISNETLHNMIAYITTINNILNHLVYACKISIILKRIIIVIV